MNAMNKLAVIQPFTFTNEFKLLRSIFFVAIKFVKRWVSSACQVHLTPLGVQNNKMITNM